MNMKNSSLTRIAAFLAVSLPCLAGAEMIPALNTISETAQAASGAADLEAAHTGASRIDGAVSPAAEPVAAGRTASDSSRRLASAASVGMSKKFADTPKARSSKVEDGKPGFGKRIATSAELPFKTSARFVKGVDNFIVGDHYVGGGDVFGPLFSMIDGVISLGKRVVCFPVYVVAGAVGLVAGVGLGFANLFTGKAG